MHKIDVLRKAVDEYGRHSIDVHRLLRRLGKQILSSLGVHLADGKHVVFGVPPSGDWKVDTDYRDAAFSSYHNNIITLAPVEMGIGVRIDNLNDDGALWIRLTLTMSKYGDQIRLAIGDETLTSVPVAYEGHVQRICEEIEALLLKLFTERVDHVSQGLYGGGNAIGFVRSAPGSPKIL